MNEIDEVALYIRFLLGLVLVAAFAGRSFNRPSWTRSYTSFVRYAASAFLFIFCQIVIYYIISLLAQHMALKLSANLQAPFALFSPTLISVAITILVARHKLIDRTLRDQLHILAGVPDVALKLTQALVDAPFHGDEEQTRDAKSLLLRRGIDGDQDWLPPAQPSQDLFLKATIVYLQVKDWEQQGRYSQFLSEVRHDFDRLRERFDRLSLKFARTMGQIEELGDIKRIATTVGLETLARTGVDVEQCDAKLKKVVNDMLLDLQEDVAAFHRALCRILVRGTLSCFLTANDYKRELGHYGYELTSEVRGPSYEPFTYAAFVLICSISLFFAIVVRAPIATLPAPVLVILITIIQLGALFIAIVPKLLWGFANAGIAKRTPLLFVLGAGLAATLFSLLVNCTFGLLRMEGLSGLMERLLEALPYLPSAFATAAATAFLVQDHRWGFSQSQAIRRLYDALFMGGVWLVMSVAMPFLKDMFTAATQAPAPQAPNMVVGALFGFAVGFALGYIVPGSFRETRSVMPPVLGTVDVRSRHLQGIRRLLSRRSSTTAAHHTVLTGHGMRVAKD